MNRERKILMNVAILVIALCMAGVANAEPMGTAFTYQGRLADANSPAEGEYDMEFKLFDQEGGSNQFGNTVIKDEVDVIDGYFTVQLDFVNDANVFDGDARWLEIKVRPGEIEGDNSFVALSPRQEITPVPYALHTRGIFVDRAGNVGVSTDQPTEKLHVNGDIRVNNIRMSNSDITDNESIRMIIDVDNDQTNQTFTVWRDSDSWAKELFRVQENGNVGIGTINPLSMLQVETDASRAIHGKAAGDTGKGVRGTATATGGGVENYGGYFSAAGEMGKGVYGEATATGLYNNYGGYFEAASSYGRGVFGKATGESGRGVDGLAEGSQGQGVLGTATGIVGVGVKGLAGGETAYGVYGEATATGFWENYGGYFEAAGDIGHGVYGKATGTQGIGVQGNAVATGDTTNYGGLFTAAGDEAYAVYGLATATGRLTNYGGWFRADGDEGRGVHGECPGNWGVGLEGEVSGNLGKAVVGQATATGAFQNYGGHFVAWGDDGRGVFGRAVGPDGHAVHGEATATIGENYGGYFTAAGDLGRGVRAKATGSGGVGVLGSADGDQGCGVVGIVSGASSSAYAVFGHALDPNAYAGYFGGKVHITGNLSKGGGSFLIDHPLDPANKYLQHSFVESPDMMNVYNGNVALDEKGQATVQFPDYFGALNRDFRYQLTAIGAPAPNLYVAEKISDNRFEIAGGKPGMEVSWQITGVRHDAYAVANRIKVEEDKPVEARGSYLHPEAYGLPKEKSIETAYSSQPFQAPKVARKVGES
jgi:hypothetical protein